jgi:tRNA A-37 threonylcarbamoyl transferase component Bud32
VDQLHEIGVVWGDGKAGNVIIDNDDIAWLIDFGGGWTEGWVDEELADTVEGDEQAVRNIIKFLDIGK